MTRSIILILLAISSSPSLYSATEKNWPLWRFDVNRTASSPHELPKNMSLLWSRQLPSPLPSFPRDPRMCVDLSYEPVAAEGMVFLPSMVDDSITCYDGQTGKVKWKYFTEGPIRFAPVFWKNKLFFGSDDGNIYCVNAETGNLLWKFRALPDKRADLRLLGNERLISRDGLVTLCPRYSIVSGCPSCAV